MIKKTRDSAYEIVMNLRKKGYGWRKLYKILKEEGYNISTGSICHWIYKGGKPRLKELSDDSKILTPEKAYILSVVGPGDGFVKSGREGVGLSVIDEDFASKFKYCLEKVYGYKCREYIRKPAGFGKKNLFNVFLYSKNVVKDILDYGVKFNEKEWTIPEIIKNAPLNIQCAYLSGFADSQGCVKKREVVIFSQNRKGLKEFQEIVLGIGLRTSIQKRKDGYVLSIHSRRSLEFFYKNIGFSIKRKENKLRDVLDDYKRYYMPKELIDDLKSKIKSYINLGYSQRKTARLCGISQTAVRNRIKEVF